MTNHETRQIVNVCSWRHLNDLELNTIETFLPRLQDKSMRREDINSIIWNKLKNGVFAI